MCAAKIQHNLTYHLGKATLQACSSKGSGSPSSGTVGAFVGGGVDGDGSAIMSSLMMCGGDGPSFFLD